MKHIITLQTNIDKLFETYLKRKTIPAESDEGIIFNLAPYIQ